MNPVKVNTHVTHDRAGLLTPYLNIRGAAAAIEFYKKVFGAIELVRLPAPDGKIIHAQIKIGNNLIMLSDEMAMMKNHSPSTLKGTPVSFYLDVANADETFRLALEEGATQVREMEDRFYGDRVGVIADPFGHVWSIATQKEHVAPDEIKRRATALFHQN